MLLVLALALPLLPQYRLVWADEFDVDGPPNPANWGYEKGFVRNQELQWYQPENATVKGGILTIEGRRETVANPAYDPQSKDWRLNREKAEYTSASIRTMGKRQWLYGRFEVRARIDARKGLWPAIWFLGNGPWPSAGEIDLMEFYQDTILANVAWGTGGGTWDTAKTPIGRYIEKSRSWTRLFHTWRMDWDAQSIKLFLDDELLNETSLSKTVNPDGTNPFHKPQYLILNLAIGSTGGDPSETRFPATFEVDYVRVYEQAR